MSELEILRDTAEAFIFKTTLATLPDWSRKALSEGGRAAMMLHLRRTGEPKTETGEPTRSARPFQTVLGFK